MTKKKSQHKPRTTYECSLDYATKRLEKALQEQHSFAAKLQAIEQEIPRLQAAIHVLSPLVNPPTVVAMPTTFADEYNAKLQAAAIQAQVTAAATAVTVMPPPLRAVSPAAGVPAHLAKFVQHIPQTSGIAPQPPNGDTNPNAELDQDAFLTGALGKELLP